MGKVFKAPMLAADKAALAKVTAKLQAPTVDFVTGSKDAEVFFQVTGSKALIANLNMLPKIALDAAGYEMAQIAREVIDDAKENYVPTNTFALRDSGDSDDYDPAKTEMDIAQISMWFGGVVTKEMAKAGIRDVQHYALEQHENLEFHHPALDRKTGQGGPVGGGPPGSGTGGPKYLERPFAAVQGTVVSRIAVKVAEAFAKSGSDIQNPAFVAFALS